MKIGIDISQTAHRGTGVARFTEGLSRAILEMGTDEWTFFFSSLRGTMPAGLERDIKARGYDLKRSRIPPTALSLLWNTAHLVRIERFIGPQDWVITSDWTEPPAKANKSTIVHDLTFMRHPETVDPKIREVQEKRLTRVKRESRLIFADSKATRQDLIDLLGIDPQRITVNYPGVTVSTPTVDRMTKTQFSLGLHKPFILAVGKVEPRKNLKRLIEVFAKLNLKDVELVIAGPPGWEQLDARYDNVRFLGYVSDADLFALYCLCQFLVYPSLYEGFGYPPVEAMMLGCPVAMSNAGSLGEIGSGAAHLFDPTDNEAMAEAIRTVLKSEKRRKELAAAGKDKSKKYTWKNYYKTMMEALRI